MAVNIISTQSNQSVLWGFLGPSPGRLVKSESSAGHRDKEVGIEAGEKDSGNFAFQICWTFKSALWRKEKSL